jgi:hypothetical protein
MAYLQKLSSIREKKQKLLAQETKLIEKRKKEIANLAEKFELLTMSDTIIVGVFSEAQSAIKDKSDKVKLWEQSGEKFIKTK